MDVFSKPYGENEDFNARIAPFYWVEHEGSFSLCLSALEGYKKEVFATRANEGFRGNGDDWDSLASVFLDEKTPELKDVLEFDPETGMFAAYSTDADALAKFGLAFKDACEDDALIRDLFSRAGVDHILDEKSVEELYGKDMADTFRQTQELQKGLLEIMKESGGSSIFRKKILEELEKSGDQTTELYKLLNLKD
jgi:hypothetical protein